MKTYKLFRFAFTAILLLMVGVSHAQLSGNYTIGGSNPDFTTLLEVTSALKTSGISEPVMFNIRGCAKRALHISQPISGVSGSAIIQNREDYNEIK